MLKKAINAWKSYIKRSIQKKDDIHEELKSKDLKRKQINTYIHYLEVHIDLVQRAKEYMELFQAQPAYNKSKPSYRGIRNEVGEIALNAYANAQSVVSKKESSNEERLKIAIESSEQLLMFLKSRMLEVYRNSRERLLSDLDDLNRGIKTIQQPNINNPKIVISHVQRASILMELDLIDQMKRNCLKLYERASNDGTSYIKRYYREKEILAAVGPIIAATFIDLFIGFPVLTPTVGPGTVVAEKILLEDKRSMKKKESIRIAQELWWQNNILFVVPLIAVDIGQMRMLSEIRP